jgi:hypothetical protein
MAEEPQEPRPLGRARRAKRQSESPIEPSPGEVLAGALSEIDRWLTALEEEYGVSRESVARIMEDPVIGPAFPALCALQSRGDEAEFTRRKEANALVAMAVRNGPLEDFHSQGVPVGNREMKEIMVFAGRRMNTVLALRDALNASGPGGRRLWKRIVVAYHHLFCRDWEVTDRGEVMI